MGIKGINFCYCCCCFLAKYYSSAITEIGLALFSTCVILNFYYKRDTMPNWMKTFMFRILRPLVRIKYKSQPTNKFKRNSCKQFLIEENCELSEITGNPYSGPCEVRKMTTINEASCEENGSCNEVQQHVPLQRTRSRRQNSIHETPILNDHAGNHHQGKYIFGADDELRENELTNNHTDWQTAAKILDRVVLILGILISVATFLAIFLQAPRVREMFYL